MQLYHTQPAVRYEWEEGSDESFPVSPGSTSNVVIVVACYGMGEPTDSAKEWYDWLMSAEREAAGSRQPPRGQAHADGR